ncbi:MAG TPA: ribosomal protein S18-alanine N-acetyltransferase [Burkholderiales bacterium]|nr:ribosomal protein S18-alanine N-acetyltransferase [Burkholderiales bacterium]
MSAVLRPAPRFEPMSEADLRPVIEIEESLYEFPWTLGNFRDSLRAGYDCWVVRDGRQLIGYAVLILAAGEAHLLNLSIAARVQRRGHGRSLLEHVIGIARERETKTLFLEVRPTNAVGQRLYAGYGFKQVGVRRGYYPARRGREDALVLALEL